MQQKSVHNAYERDEPPFDQLAYHRARSIEFDIHVGRATFAPLTGDWYVYHVNIPGWGTTQCTKLSDCLDEVRAFHLAFPEHEVVTLMIDAKDDFEGEGTHTPKDLDSRILAHLDSSWIAKPSDLLAACPQAVSLRQAVTGSCAWPRLDALRGKFFLVLTGGSACASASRTNQYVTSGATARDRVAFVAPNIDAKCSFASYTESKPHAVFFNMDFANVASAPAVRAAGLVGRVYYGGLRGGLDERSTWDVAKTSMANLLATDQVNSESAPWARTHTTTGWPFTCFAGCDPKNVEAGRTIGIKVDSGDMTGAYDDFYFARERQSNGVTAWSTLITTASSNVDEWAKGCLMARASDDAESAYFAVCRTADKHAIRLQYRPSNGASTIEEDTASGPSDTLTEESTFFARLTVDVEETLSRATAEVSRDGVTWVVIDTKQIAAALVLQGLAASSHGSGPAKFLFGNVARQKNDGPRASYSAAGLPGIRIGACPFGQAFDGIFP